MAAIHMAAQRGRLLSMRALLKHKGLDINLKTPFAHGAETGLHIAARLGKSKVRALRQNLCGALAAFRASLLAVPAGGMCSGAYTPGGT